MPAHRAILTDIAQLGLDPTKAYSNVTGAGQLKPPVDVVVTQPEPEKVEIVETLQVLEPESVASEPEQLTEIVVETSDDNNNKEEVQNNNKEEVQDEPQPKSETKESSDGTEKPEDEKAIEETPKKKRGKKATN